MAPTISPVREDKMMNPAPDFRPNFGVYGGPREPWERPRPILSPIRGQVVFLGKADGRVGATFSDWPCLDKLGGPVAVSDSQICHSALARP